MGTKKILIADDFEGIILSLKSALEKKEYQVTYCKNGKIALNTLKNSSFDLVITDIDMPEMNGIELITELRQVEELKEIPVLVMTKEKDMKEESKKAGASGWVVKPISVPRVMQTIEALL